MNIESEIVLLDDASLSEFLIQYRELELFTYVKIERNNKNEGRQSARQRLARIASHDNLLFLDCDSTILNDNFLAKYLHEIETDNRDVICGGRVYVEKAPENCTKRLHWKYGVKRENIHSTTGKSKRFLKKFHSNNFLIKKTTFLSLPFFKGFRNYGHEDTYWGLVLQESGIEISIIYNPVLHADIEEADTFLRKSNEALENLKSLAFQIQPEILSKYVKLFRVYRYLKATRCQGLTEKMVVFFEQAILKNLKSCHPNLLLFDLYRLSYFIRIMSIRQ